MLNRAPTAAGLCGAGTQLQQSPSCQELYACETHFCQLFNRRLGLYQENSRTEHNFRSCISFPCTIRYLYEKVLESLSRIHINDVLQVFSGLLVNIFGIGTRHPAGDLTASFSSPELYASPFTQKWKIQCSNKSAQQM